MTVPIQSGDIKLFASQVMDDVAEGGGGPTSIVIRDGVSNDVFQDLSEVARTGGRTYMRKLFLGVDTDNTERYLDANIILSDPPADPRVSVTLYSTKETFDRRNEARSRAEGYYGSGSEWHGYLLENHIKNQQNITLLQRPGTTLPTPGRKPSVPFSNVTHTSTTASSRLATGPAATMATRRHTVCWSNARCISVGATSPSRLSSMRT